jgi:hypothetical protein
MHCTNKWYGGKVRKSKNVDDNPFHEASPPNVFIGGPAGISPGFPLQPKADPSEALWRKKHAGMTDFEKLRNRTQEIIGLIKARPDLNEQIGPSGRKQSRANYVR